MKPYILITGSDDKLTEFEDRVSEALEQGYELSGDLICQHVTSQTLLFQPMIFEEILEYDEDEDEEELEIYESELVD